MGIPSKSGEPYRIMIACLINTFEQSASIMPIFERNLHFVLQLSCSSSAFIHCFELVGQRYVQIPWFLVIGLAGESSGDQFPFLDFQNLSQVKDGLFPVRILGMWASGELDGLVTSAKLDVKPGNQRMNKVIPLTSQSKGQFECQILFLDLVEVDSVYDVRICHASFHFNSVDKWLGQCGILQWSEVKAIDIVPD